MNDSTTNNLKKGARKDTNALTENKKKIKV